MGIFSSPPPNRFYVPPVGRNGRSPHGTLLGGPPRPPATWYDEGPNVVRVSGGSGSDTQIAQQTAPDVRRAPDNHYLRFDGRYLKLFNGDEVVKEWPAVSGRENFGSSADQGKKNYGPMPEGTYDIKQSRYQTISPVNRIAGPFGMGEWQGGVRSWGTESVWADPTPETVRNGLTLGRTDMAIHGGTIPGSAGCIDLTSQMGDFGKALRRLGRDLKLYVDYNPPAPENGLNVRRQTTR